MTYLPFSSRSFLAAGAVAAMTVFGASAALAGGGYESGKTVGLDDANASVRVVDTAQVAASVTGDIVDIASGDGSFSTLVEALTEAGLVETLKGAGPFTVFAPTDAAFAKLPSGTVEDLMKPENREQLTQILTYHVVPGAVTSGDIAGQTLDVETVAGIPLSIDATGSGVMVGGASVTTADVMASNGVIHVIDTVLIPN